MLYDARWLTKVSLVLAGMFGPRMLVEEPIVTLYLECSPKPLAKPRGKAHGSQSLWPWQPQAPEFLGSAGQGLRQPGTL